MGAYQPRQFRGRGQARHTVLVCLVRRTVTALTRRLHVRTERAPSRLWRWQTRAFFQRELAGLFDQILRGKHRRILLSLAPAKHKVLQVRAFVQGRRESFGISDRDNRWTRWIHTTTERKKRSSSRTRTVSKESAVTWPFLNQKRHAVSTARTGVEEAKHQITKYIPPLSNE